MAIHLETCPSFLPKSFVPKTYQYPRKEIQEKTKSLFEKLLLQMKACNEPISSVIIGMKWVALNPMGKAFGENALDCLDLLKKPFFLASFAVDLIALKELLQGQASYDTPSLIRFLSMLGTRACKVIRWLEKFQLIQLSTGAFWQLKFAIYLTTLVRNITKLGEAIYYEASYSEILRLTLKLLATSITIYSAIYVTSELHIAKLMASTGAIALTYL
jgi:hypothetical protein